MFVVCCMYQDAALRTVNIRRDRSTVTPAELDHLCQRRVRATDAAEAITAKARDIVVRL